MSEPSDGALRPSSTGVLLAIGLTLGAALSVAAAASGISSAQRPLPGGLTADGPTALVALLGQAVAFVAGGATLGLLAAQVVFAPLTDDETPRPPDDRLRRWLVRSAQVWFAASVLMTFANPSFVEGVRIGDALRPDAWWNFVTATTSDLAWVASMLVSLGVVVVGLWGRTTSAFAVAWGAGALVAVFVAVSGSISVGLNHDWATDAVGLATLALVLLISGAVGALVVTLTYGPSDDALRRYHRWVPVLWAVVLVGYGVGAWQQLAGTSPFDTVYGMPVVAGSGLLVLFAASWLWRQIGERGRDGSWRRAAASLTGDVVLLILGLTAITVAAYLFPPRYRVPQTIQVNYLGYEMDTPATIARIVGFGRVNLLWLTLSALALGLYAWGVIRLRRRGERWPISRPLFWAAGWGLTLYLAVSGLWEYSTAVFSWHMLVHMTVNMMIPVLLVLGAPLTLMTVAARPRLPGELVGAAAIVDALQTNRLVRFLLSPAVVWVNYVGSLFGVYYTGVFPWLMKYHWGHQLMLLYFLLAGYLFFAPLVGPDRHPWHLPYIIRFALLMSIMPFHAIFAVGIMQSKTLLGGQFYQSIDLSWVGDLLKDQNIAGQVTWFTGEGPALVAVLMMAVQWFRTDTAQAEAADVLAVGGTADELDAYNDMLAQLAERDREASTTYSKEGDW